MKRLITIVFALSLLGGAAAKERRFAIRGEIEGLQAGDTLRFERIGLPKWTLSRAFDVVVSEPGKFEYSGRQPHAEYLMMTCLPREGELPESGRMGLTMIVDGGTVRVVGTRDEIYFSRVEGEAFGDQPLLAEATRLDYSITRERSRHLRRMREAFAAGDSVKGREYQKQFNEFRAEDDEKRVAELEKKFLYANPSSPWSLVRTLQRSSNTPVDTLEAYYGRLDRRARDGYFGTRLKGQIERRKFLLPGQPAPDFTATLPDGRTKSAHDFRGKYLLIYHWGFCPGSIQREMDAVELYRRHGERLEILGVTERLSAYAEVAAITPEHETMFGIRLRPVYESMAAHPWIDVEADANPQIDELYDFAGFPFFILISPDGKIVSRGFHDTFFEAKEILEKL